MEFPIYHVTTGTEEPPRLVQVKTMADLMRLAEEYGHSILLCAPSPSLADDSTWGRWHLIVVDDYLN